MALMSCPHCGKKISDTSDKCMYCGENIKEIVSEKKQEVKNEIGNKKRNKQNKVIMIEGVIGAAMILFIMFYISLVMKLETFSLMAAEGLLLSILIPVVRFLCFAFGENRYGNSNISIKKLIDKYLYAESILVWQLVLIIGIVVIFLANNPEYSYYNKDTSIEISIALVLVVTSAISTRNNYKLFVGMDFPIKKLLYYVDIIALVCFCFCMGNTSDPIVSSFMIACVVLYLLSFLTMLVPKYISVIKDSGFPILLEYKNIDQETKVNYGNIVWGCKDRLRHNYLSLLKVNDVDFEEELKSLEELEDKILLLKFSKKDDILGMIDWLIINLKNIIKNKNILVDGRVEKLEINKHVLAVFFEGNIYFFDEDSYEMYDDETVTRDQIDSFGILYLLEDAPTYNPNFKTVDRPSIGYIYDNPKLNAYNEREYMRDMAEYQANLIDANLHNQREREKYIDSLGKTIEVEYIFIMLNKESPFTLTWNKKENLSLMQFLKNEYPDVEWLDQKELKNRMELLKTLQTIETQNEKRSH